MPTRKAASPHHQFLISLAPGCRPTDLAVLISQDRRHCAIPSTCPPSPPGRPITLEMPVWLCVALDICSDDLHCVVYAGAHGPRRARESGATTPSYQGAPKSLLPRRDSPGWFWRFANPDVSRPILLISPFPCSRPWLGSAPRNRRDGRSRAEAEREGGTRFPESAWS